uniref:AAA-like domain protein n=1 Tax=Myoviridae sp. ctUX613 TaxID=2826660 RepID=A0A8S5NBL6_9CAUD|nr:MAG TPA: AAA-like domain protein [Myoviridae sp. ctUX613]
MRLVTPDANTFAYFNRKLVKAAWPSSCLIQGRKADSGLVRVRVRRINFTARYALTGFGKSAIVN